MRKTILIIGAGPIQVPGILRAKQMGLNVVATDGDPEAVGFQNADSRNVVDVRDWESTLTLAKRQQISGVCCFAVESALRTVAAVSNELGLPGISILAAEKATRSEERRVGKECRL